MIGGAVHRWGVLALAGCAQASLPDEGPPPVILVSIDTLRADRVGALGNGRGLTPNLDAFAAEAVVFEDAWTTANITSMAHASLFTGRYPSELGEAGPTFRLGTEAPTLAGVLSLYGYDAAAFTAGGHLGPGFGLERGFTTFRPTTDIGSLWHTVPAALDWLDTREGEGPPFLFVHGYDAHAPYVAPAPYGLAWGDGAAHPGGDAALHSLPGTELVFDRWLFRSEDALARLHRLDGPRVWDAAAHAAMDAAARAEGAVPFDEADGRRVRDAYDGAVAYADAMFGVFVAGLRARGTWDRAVVIVLADHGESLGEEGRYGHGDALTEAELHVPLLVKAPGAVARRVDASVSLLDVMPTVLELAGAPAPAEQRGGSLAGWLHGGEGRRPARVNAEGNARMVTTREAGGWLTFAGISADSPYLSAVLSAAALDGPAFSGEGDREALRRGLLAWRAELAPAGPVRPADPGAVEAMRARGYWAAP